VKLFKGKFGTTELMSLAVSGEVASVKRLLEQGVAVDDTNDHSQTALMFAAAAGHPQVIRILLSSGADGESYTSDSSSEFHALLTEAQGHLI
jgi:ankyrin repeat protein